MSTESKTQTVAITSSDAELLIMQLERNAGAHAHTAGKARNYLRRIADKPIATITGNFSRCTTVEFIKCVRAAAYKGEWNELDNLMRGWW